jgi:hypothetical protein
MSNATGIYHEAVLYKVNQLGAAEQESSKKILACEVLVVFKFTQH